MTSLKPKGIEFRFGLILLICLAGGLGVAGYISYALEFRQAREEVMEKARVLLATVIAVRTYTVGEVAPLLQHAKSDNEFHPQSVPSYAAQSAMSQLNREFPTYKYHESSLNPTNVADRAADWEVGMFRAFQQNLDLKELSGENGSGGDARFYLARPIRLSNPACLECHSTPEAAPKAMVAKYGASNGFNWKLNDIVGLQIIEVPLLPTQRKAINGVLVTMGSLICVFTITSAVFLYLLRHYVTNPLATITGFAHSISLGHESHDSEPQSELLGQFKDLKQAVMRMKASVEQAERLLREKHHGRGT